MKYLIIVVLLTAVFYFSNGNVNVWDEDIMTAPPTNGVPIWMQNSALG